MKNLNRLIIALCIVSGIASCKQEAVDVEKESDKFAEGSVSTQRYVYKGSTYKINLRKGTDGYQLVDGEDNQKVQLLLEGPSTAQVVNAKDPNTIYVFDSYKESQDFAKSNSSAESGRINADPARCYLYTETGYGGTYNYNYADDHCGPLSINNICYIPDYTYYRLYRTPENYDQYISLNDAVGSLYIYNPAVSNNVRVAFWEDPNYIGRSITFWCQDKTEFGVSDLGSYRFGGVWGNKYSWNDRISSSIFYRY